MTTTKAALLLIATTNTMPVASFSLPLLVAIGTPTPGAAGTEITLPPMTVSEYLRDKGLSCCVGVITRKSGWIHYGGGVDSISDVKHLNDELIDTLPLPALKRNVLKQLSSEEREASAQEKRERMSSAASRFSFLSATLESKS